MSLDNSRGGKSTPSFGLSDRLRRFLISNNIYEIDMLTNLSMRLIASLRDYDESIREEILWLKISNGKKRSFDIVQKQLFICDKPSRPATMGSNEGRRLPITSVDELPCSTRLRNVIISSGYEYQSLDFLALDDDILMTFPNFGRTTLSEVQALRVCLKAVFEKQSVNETSRVAQVEQISSGEQNIISHELAISIPVEVRDLSFEIILLFQRRTRPLKRNRYTRLLARFSTFGAIDGYTKSDLYLVPGIGRASVKTLLQWLEYFHTGSFRSLVDRLTTHRNYPVSRISCSRELHAFLREHHIRIINEITSLDSMDFAEAKESDKLAILELRTLNIHPDTGKLMTGINFASSSQTLIETIDNFLGNEVSSKRRSILLGRWGAAEGIRTKQEVGRMHGLTRERARQVVEQEIIMFRKGYVLNEENLLGSFYKVVISILSPISFSDLTQGKQHKPKYNEEFYLGFLSEVFDTVPFEGYLYAGRTYPPTELDLLSLASEPDLVELRQHFMQMSNNERLAYLKVILLSGRLTLDRQGDKVYVNQIKYGMIPVLKQCIRIKDKPTHLDEYCYFLENHPLYDKGVNRKSVYNALNRVPEFITIDYHVWGFEKHLSYTESDWPAIQEKVRRILQSSGQQMDAGVLFELVRKSVPILRSKYELVHILRKDPQLRDLGFFTFVLSESDQTNRIILVDVIADLFETEPDPKHSHFIWEKVKQERSWSRHGVHTTLRQIEWLEQYKPSFFGLKTRRTDNLRYLSQDVMYINKYITYCHPQTNADEIRTDLGFDGSIDDFIDLLKSSDMIIPLQSSGSSGDLYLVSREWTPLQLSICMLTNSTRPIFLDEMLFTLKDELGIDKYNRNKLLHHLENNVRVNRLNNGSFEYNDIIEDFHAYLPLLDEVEAFLSASSELVTLEDLYETITHRSKSPWPDNPQELLTLLELDIRFVILADNLIGLL